MSVNLDSEITNAADGLSGRFLDDVTNACSNFLDHGGALCCKLLHRSRNTDLVLFNDFLAVNGGTNTCYFNMNHRYTSDYRCFSHANTPSSLLLQASELNSDYGKKHDNFSLV